MTINEINAEEDNNSEKNNAEKGSGGITDSTEKNLGDIFGVAEFNVSKAKEIQEKMGREFTVLPFSRKGYQKISIDESKEELKQKYGKQILADMENAQTKPDQEKYAGKTDEEKLDIYFEITDPQIIITATTEKDVYNVELHHFSEFQKQGYQGKLTGTEIENEIENFKHFIKTGETVTRGVKRNEIFSYDDFDPSEYTG